MAVIMSVLELPHSKTSSLVIALSSVMSCTSGIGVSTALKPTPNRQEFQRVHEICGGMRAANRYRCAGSAAKPPHLVEISTSAPPSASI